jgi:hypothetical protein
MEGPRRGIGRDIRIALLTLGVVGATLLTPALRPADAATVTQVLSASADTYVDASTPSTILGAQATLNADASPTRYVFIRFDLSAVGGTITAASLRLHAQDSTNAASPAGGTVRAITSTTWSEPATTYANRPSTSGTTVGSFGAVARNAWYQLNALAVAKQGAVLNLSIVSTNTDGASYDARETGANGPQIVLTIDTQPAGALTLQPTADTYVENGTAATTNFGTATSISADASPIRQAFLRFNLAGVATITSARLRLHVSNSSNGPSPAGGTVSRVTGAWAETTATYDTRPTLGSSVGAFGAVGQNAWVELDVTTAAVAGAILELGLSSANTDGAYYDSREAGATGPQLVITTTSPSPTPTVLPTPTVAPTPSTGGIVIAAVGDMVCAPTSAVTSTTCRQLAVSSLINGDPAVQAFLALGDLQYPAGELANFQTAYEASYGRFKAKTKPAPGNHEYETSNATGYYAYFGSLAGDPTKGYYSADIGTSWHVVSLNSNCTFVSCAAGSAQEQWLRADLAASTRPCTIAYWHHPRFVSSSRGDNTNTDPLWRAIAADGAELVLAGHEHVYERFAPLDGNGTADANGVRSLVVGTGGASMGSFGTTHANSLLRVRTFGVLKLTLLASSYSWQMIAENGSVLDSGTGTCH